jgi:hypothetical protein
MRAAAARALLNAKCEPLYKNGTNTYNSSYQTRRVPMTEETFEMFVQREQSRLHGEREAIFIQQQELETKLADINRQLSAIDAYEAARSGKPLPARQTRSTGTRRPRGARRGSKRDELLKVIREGGGLTRGQILEKMGLKGNKSGEMSVSNALTALTKSNQVARREGRYISA